MQALTERTEAPRLETERLVLRAHGAGDLADSAALWADPEVVRLISGQPSTIEAAWSRLLRYAGHWRLLGFGYWLVEARADGRFLGEVGLAEYHRRIEPDLGGRPEAGWVFATAAQKQGFAGEAMRAVLAWADARHPAGETVCIMAPEHAASARLARRLGYRAAGRARYRGESVDVMVRPAGG